jgi:signal transduction histidine kinase
MTHDHPYAGPEQTDGSREIHVRTDDLWEHLPIGALVVDPGGHARSPNRRARQILGWNGVDPRPLNELVPGADSEQPGAELPVAGGDRTVRLFLHPLPDGSHAAFLEDVTALDRERARREHAERLAAVGELAAGVAHEVNNPLASIKSFAQLLSNEVTSGAHREALEIIVQESSRVAKVVGELLSVARRQGVAHRVAVDLNETAERVLSLQRYALQASGVEIRRDFDASLPAVLGEPGALQQVLLNLVVNAEQALSGKTGARLLILRTRESSEGIVLSVVDNGPGIPRDRLPHIFDPFHTTKPEGTGLGLGISAAIVRDHGGHIWAESEPSRGAAFFVRLPRAAGPVVSTPPPRAEATATRRPVRPLRVLVADDEPTLRLAVALYLGRFGHEVRQAGNAGDAFRLAETEPFDVAVVDARMPGDGLRLLEQLEELPGLHGRTILVTGDIGRIRSTHGVGTVRPFLAKPFDMEELARLVEKLGG